MSANIRTFKIPTDLEIGLCYTHKNKLTKTDFLLSNLKCVHTTGFQNNGSSHT